MTALRQAPLTVLVIAACVLLFVADALGPDGAALLAGTSSALPPILAAAVVDPAKVDAGEWWRLVTAGFVHFSLLHLAFNMLALWQVGRYTEPRLGTPRFGLVYVVALLGGDVLAYATTVGTPVVTAGASGAIMGAFGAMLVLTLILRTEREALRPAALTIALTLANGLGNPGISNAGHVGGLVAGVAAALAIVTRRPSAWIAAVRAHETVTAAAPLAPPQLPDLDTVPDVWPAGSPETLVVGMRRRTAVTYTVLALACLMIAAYLVNAVFFDPIPTDPGWPLALIGLLVAGAAYFGLAPLRTSLTLTPAGLVQRGPFTARSVRWSDMERAYVAEVRSSGRSLRIAAFTLMPGYVFSGGALTLRGLRAAGIQRLGGLALGPDELAGLVERWRLHWLRHPRTLAEELPRDGVTAVGGVIALVAVLLAVTGTALAVTEGIEPIEALRAQFPAGARLVHAKPRELMLDAAELPALGYTVQRDRATDANTQERSYASRSSSFSLLILNVDRAAALFGSRDLAGERCDGRWTFGEEKVTTTTIDAPSVGLATKGCRYAFSDGSRAILLVTLHRNVAIDALVVADARASDVADATVMALARQLAVAQIAKIDRVAPPR